MNSRVSGKRAFRKHGILLQSPVVCTVLTLSTAVGSARNVQYGGVTIEFSHLAPRLFTGFETRDGFNLALPEKALLDTIYLRKAIPFRDELEFALLDRERLDRMANDFPGPTRKLVQTIRLCLQGTGAKKN